MMGPSEPFDDELVRLFDLSVDALCIAGFDGYLKLVNPAFAHPRVHAGGAARQAVHG
jgi:hypothetical protein